MITNNLFELEISPDHAVLISGRKIIGSSDQGVTSTPDPWHHNPTADDRQSEITAGAIYKSNSSGFVKVALDVLGSKKAVALLERLDVVTPSKKFATPIVRLSEYARDNPGHSANSSSILCTPFVGHLSQFIRSIQPSPRIRQ